MKKISKMATASVLLFTLANPLGVLAENNVENISATSNNKLTQDITIQAKEVNGGIVFEVTAAKDTYNTVIHTTINGQKFTYNLGNLKKGQVSKVVQPDVSVNRKDANDVNTNKKDAAISKENRTEKSLPNTSVVRELVEKTVSYNTELNGNVIEANVVYKTYELVEKKDEKAIEKETKPVDSKVETPVESTETKATEPEAAKPATPKVEAPAESTEAKATEPEVAKPATPKAETPVESTEAKATEPEVAKPATPKAETPVESTETKATEPEAVKPVTPAPKEEKPATSAPKVEAPTKPSEPEEAGEGVKPTPKEDGSEGKVSETPGTTGETSGTTSEEAGKEVKPAPKEDASEGKVSETPGATGEASGTTEGAKPGATTEEGTSGAAGEASGTTSENVKSKEETLKTEKKEGRETIEKIVTIKSDAIEKVENPEEKAKLKEQLENLKMKALEEIDKVTDPEKMADVVAKNQEEIDAIEVPGEEYTKPNYSKDNLSNGRNDGTMIEGGSTAIGHGSGEAPSGTEQPAPTEGTDNSSATTSPTQPATGTNSDSTVTDQPQPSSTEEQPAATTEPESSVQPKNESSASTGVATQPEATSASTGAATQPSPAAETTSTAATTESTPTAQPQPAVTAGNSSFRRAGEYQARARRVARAANQPDGTVNISYNYDGMPDINGFLSDPGENNTVAIPNSATEDKVKELVKAKIQAKAQELAKYGYTVKEKIIFEQDTNVKNFNYVITFTKEKTGTTGFRIAPEVQVRAKKVVKRDLSNKTKQINIYYNLTALKDIAGALGNVRENNLLTLPGNATKEEIKKAIEEKTKSQIEQLNKQGFKVTSTTDLDRIVEGSDNYDYVVEFTKETKAQSVGNTGFRKAPATQRRAKRSTETQENVDVNIYFNLKTLPGIAGALDVDGDTTIKLPKDATVEQVKAAIQTKIAKVEKRGYKVSDFYFGAKTERGYDFVVEFKK